MAVFKLKIGTLDVSGYIAAGGYSWELNDIDAPNSGRDMNGKMHRKRIASKNKISVTCRSINESELTLLNDALDADIVNVDYYNPGKAAVIQNAKFYSSQIQAAVVMDVGGGRVFEGIKFDLIEV